MKTIYVIVVLIILAPFLTACVYSAIYTARTEEAHPAAGIFLELNEAKTHIVRQGQEGPTVLMIHGASANAQEFTHTLSPRLRDTHRVLMADRPGHGYSVRPKNASTLKVQAEQMAGILEALAPGEKTIVVGHSFGGGVALRLALDRPDLVSALVLAAPVSHDWGTDAHAWYSSAAANPVYGGAFAQIIPAAGPRQVRESISGVFSPEPAPDGYFDNSAIGLLFRPSHFRANARDVLKLRSELAAQQGRYGELSMPIAVFSGLQDSVIKPKFHVDQLAKQVPQLERIDYPDGGHMPHHAHGDEIADKVREISSALAAN
ncbi:MAG: alpha/beta hydrolase [Hyphomonadaceae bacterium]